MALGPLGAPKEGPGLAADIKDPLGGDVYLVRWVVLSEDGHSSSGEFRFGVERPERRAAQNAELLTATGGPADQLRSRTGRPASRCAGSGCSALRCSSAAPCCWPASGAGWTTRSPDVLAARWTRAGPPRPRLLTLAGSVAAVVAAAGAGAGGTQCRSSWPPAPAPWPWPAWPAWWSPASRRLLGRPGPRRDQFLGMAGAFFLGAEAVGGHITAITSAWRFPAIVAQGAHLAAAAMWVGGLAVLAYAAGRRRRCGPAGGLARPPPPPSGRWRRSPPRW